MMTDLQNRSLPALIVWRCRVRIFFVALRLARAFVTLSEWVCPFDLDDPGKVNLHNPTLPVLMIRAWRIKAMSLAMRLSRHIADVGAVVCPFELRARA